MTASEVWISMESHVTDLVTGESDEWDCVDSEDAVIPFPAVNVAEIRSGLDDVHYMRVLVQSPVLAPSVDFQRNAIRVEARRLRDDDVIFQLWRDSAVAVRLVNPAWPGHFILPSGHFDRRDLV